MGRWLRASGDRGGRRSCWAAAAPRRRRRRRGARDGHRRRPTRPTATARRRPQAQAQPAARRGLRLVQGRQLRVARCTSPRRPATAGACSWSSRAAGSWSCAAAASCRTPFLDLSSKTDGGGEQGLLSMAFAPDYAESGRFYVYYTDNNGDTRVVEYRRASADRADPRSARLVLTQEQPEPNHNGGLVLFGPDGLLYIGLGDGGGGGRPARLARQRAEPRHAAGQDPAHRPAPERRPALPRAALEPVRRALRRARRDLQLRPAQPVALLLRPPHGRPHDRRRRPERDRGDRLRAPRPRQGRELRLAPVRGAQPLHAGRVRARPRPARDRAPAQPRQLLDHRRRGRARPHGWPTCAGATCSATSAAA